MEINQKRVSAELTGALDALEAITKGYWEHTDEARLRLLVTAAACIEGAAKEICGITQRAF